MRKRDFPQGRTVRTLWQREEVGVSFLLAGILLFGASLSVLIGPRLQERQTRGWSRTDPEKLEELS